jgi:hypothetical protein
MLPFLRKCCTAIIVIMCPDIAWPRVTFPTGRVLKAACREFNQKRCDVTLVCAITSCNRGVHCLLALILTASWNVNHAVHIIFCILMQNTNLTVFHNNVTNLIHFHFHNHFIVSWSSTCFGRQASIFRRHYTSSFWCELHALVAFGWLQVVGRLAYWALGCGCRSGGLVGCGLTYWS